MLQVVDQHGEQRGDVAELFKARALARYGYERAALRYAGRLQVVDGNEHHVESRPEVEAWRMQLHHDVRALAHEGAQEALRKRGAPLPDNKETFLIEWGGETWYVQFWDGEVFLATSATVRAGW